LAACAKTQLALPFINQLSGQKKPLRFKVAAGFPLAEASPDLKSARMDG